ncbi:MAG: hypothetical protein IJK83_06955 [Clostridiales bacterium]|nr:hypothetical protein [Clostridiales bacterium]
MEQQYNRKRKNRIYLYLSDDEYEHLLTNVQKSGLTINEYCRQLIKNGKVTAAPPTEFRKLIWELKRIGTNLDQVLFKLNTIGEYYDEELNSCSEEIHGAVNMLYQTFRNPGGK